ncbi:MAG: hypothetical protein HOO93_13385 [Methyloglobulus sp.]|nr:hypothetical protein [Methyloglobulus sp.]
MKFLEQWWAISEEGRVLGESPRKIWLTNRFSQKAVPVAFILSILTILIHWYWFHFDYFPIKTKEQIVYIIRYVGNKDRCRLWLFLLLLGNYIFRYILYGQGVPKKQPDVLIFAPASFREIIRALVIILRQLYMVLAIYIAPIIAICGFLTIYKVV